MNCQELSTLNEQITFSQLECAKMITATKNIILYIIIYIIIYMSNGLNLLHPRKDAAEMVIVFCVSPIVPEGLVFVGMK